MHSRSIVVLLAPLTVAGAVGCAGILSLGDYGVAGGARDAANDSDGSGDGASGSDAGEGGTAPGTKLTCGGSACSTPSTCCVTTSGTTFECNAASCNSSSGGNPPALLECTGAANCKSGFVCCIRKPSGAGTFASTCKPACDDPGEAQLCEPGVTPSGCIGAGKDCRTDNIENWSLSKDYATCGGIQ